MITLYGISGSRASRNMWMLNELDLDYRHVPVNDHTGETRSAEFIQLNPNGKVPLLVDGELRLFESIAINLHIARKYGADLWFEDIDLQGMATQWSIWAMIEIDENIMHVLSADNEAQAQKEFAHLHQAAKVIDDYLQDREYLIGDNFTAADLNTAACFSGGAFMRYNFAEFINLSSWLKRCYSRQAADIADSSLQRFRDILD
jgi:glutathione S-transferase